MHIVSNAISYDPCLEAEDEVEQHLTVNADGRVWFSASALGDKSGKYKKARSEDFSIEKSVASELLGKVLSYFSEGYDELFATDIGDWVMELTNTDGEIYKFRGSRCADFEVAGIDLFDLIRDTLDMQYLTSSVSMA